jgi:hypothetical protein
MILIPFLDKGKLDFFKDLELTLSFIYGRLGDD